MTTPTDPPSYPASLYAAVHTGTPGDVDFYVQACEGAQTILELGCGDGRVLVTLADLPGRQCVGLDLDPELLDMARANAEELAPRGEVDWVEGDMRQLDLGRRFERILLPHGSLYCLLSPEDLDACLERVASHLAEDGELWLDAYAADGFHETANPADMDEEELGDVKQVEVDERRYRVAERSTWDKATQRIDATYVHTPVDGGPAVEGLLRQRYVLAQELLEALLRAGLEPIALFGAFDAEPYDPDVCDLMIVGARLASPLDDG